MIEVLKLLHAMTDLSITDCGGYTVRHLTPEERLLDFGHGYPDTPLTQKEWIWIAEVHETPVAVIIAAPTQGIVQVLRIYATKEAPKTVFVGLLRKFLADIRSRGYAKFLVFLSSERDEERRIARIITKAGGSKFLDKVDGYCGDTKVDY